LLHAILSGDNRERNYFAVDILNETDKDEQFLHQTFSGEATFHVSGHVPRHSVRIQANECPHDFVARERDSSTVNVWCALTRDRVIGPYSFAKLAVTSHNYLDMMELFAVRQMGGDNMIFQQDGATAHYATIITAFLNETFPRRWIGRGRMEAMALTISGSHNPCVNMKQIVYSVHIHNIQHLKQRIREAAASFISVVLGRVWRETKCHLDVCRATNGAHIELR
jgi:hypothetical protein